MNNRTVATLRTQGGITRITDNNNRTMGTYNSQTNVTYKGNKPIGQGNQLLRVII